jgi:hypothetical protein
VGDPSRRRGAALATASAEALFAARSTRAVGARGVLLGVAIVVVGAAVSLLRQPGAGPFDTIWAEDGSIFLTEVVSDGPLSSLTTSYAGYHHLVPRLLALVASAFPASAVAAVLAIEAAVAVALLALLVYHSSAGHLASRSSRVLVSAPVVLIPLAQGDVLNSIANFHWFGLYALFWLLIWRPAGRAGRIVAVGTVFLIAASDILVMVFVPLALWRALRRQAGGGREPLGGALGSALALGLVIHIAGLVAGTSERELAPSPVQAVSGWILRAVPAPLVGERWLGGEITARWIALAGVAWLVVGAIVLLAYLSPRRPDLPPALAVRPSWTLAIAAAAHSAGLYMLPVVLSGVATPRYAVAPALLVIVALVALLQPDPLTGRGTAPLVGLATLLAIVAAVNLRLDNARGEGPRWSDELERARVECTASGTAPAIPIPPLHETPPWVVKAPCDYLR